MLIDETEIMNQNKHLEQTIASLRNELAQNKKDIKYRIGLAIGENLRPRKKIVKIPVKLWEAFQNKEFANPAGDSMATKDPLAYHKYLQEQVRQLSFYNQKNHSDIIYTIGEEVYNARYSLKAFIRLPFRLWEIRSNNQRLVRTHEHVSSPTLPPIEGLGESILFIATNGAGLGHLTRCLAVARRIKKKQPEVEIIFLTTSLALTTIRREGFTAYCIPSLMLIKNMSSGQWNALLKTMMSQLLQLYKFSAVIFDGAMPYASITATMAKEKHIPKIWIRRGSEKNNELTEKRSEAEKDFDYVIIPGEAKEPPKKFDQKLYPVPPIIYLDKSEIWSREDVRRYLKISENKVVVYVQLGAGNINDIDSDINKVIMELRKHPGVVMVLGESIIGNELKIIEDDIVVIKDYPNSKYLNGFDFAISACGYNSFHELIYFGVPTIFLPNMNTKTDDQYARAMISQNHDAGIVVTDIGTGELAYAIDRMCDPAQNEKMRENCRKIIQENGADSAADLILRFKSAPI